MNRLPVALGDVQETLLIPLYGRAVEMRRRRPMLQDPLAVRMVDAIDYDFARFERVDNGRVRWVDLDLPDAMDLRRHFFEETDRRGLVAGSVLDPAWVDVVKQCPPPYFFAIEAVLLYLDEADVRRALRLIGSSFPGSWAAFDTGGSFMVGRQDRHPTMKFMAARMRWAWDDPREVEGWDAGLRLRDSCTFANAPRSLRSRLPLSFRVAFPALRVIFPPLITTYRLNLYTVG